MKIPLVYPSAVRTLACAALLGSGTIQAATYTWTGGSTSNDNIDNGANWQGNSAPPENGTAQVVFSNGASANNQVNLDVNFYVDSLTFGGSNAFSLGSNSTRGLDIGADGLAQNSTAAQTISVPTFLMASQTWSFASGAGALTFNNSSGSGQIITSSSARTYTHALAPQGNSTLSGTISGAGALVVNGPGTMTLAGNNTYTGTTTVNAGTLAVGTGGSITGGNVSVTTSATLAISGTGSISLSGSSSLTVNDGASTTLAGTGSLSTGTASIGSGGPGTFTQSGGSFTTNGNTFSVGGYSGGSSSYNLSGTGSLSTGAASIGDNGTGTVAQSRGTFTTNGKALDVGISIAGNGSYNLSGTGSLSTGSVIIGYEGAGTFTQSGGTFTTNGNTLTLSIPGSFGPEMPLPSSGTYTLGGGTLTTGQVAGGGGPSSFHFNGGTLQAAMTTTSFFSGLTTADVQAGGARIDTQTYNVTIAQALTSGTAVGTADGGLTKLGAGTLTLTGLNTFTGPLNIDAGTLAVAGESNLGAGTGPLTVGGGGELLFTGSVTTSRVYSLGFCTLGVASGSTLTYASGATLDGGFLGAGGTHAFADGSSLYGTTAVPGSVLTTSGAVFLTNATVRGSLTQTGGTLTASGTVISSAGTLNVSGTVNTSGVEIDGVTTINAGGTVANSGSNLVFGGGARTTINSGGTLSAASGTSIELNGALLVNNGTLNGTLDVNYGSIFKGSGGGSATVNVTSGGTFSPGNSPGTASVGSLSLQAAGRYQFELTSATAANNSPGNSADLISVSQLLTISAGATANSRFTVAVVSLDTNDNPAALTDFDPSKSYRFVLATSAGVSGYRANEFTVDTSGFANGLAGGSFSVVQDGNNLDLVFTPVPEPGAWTLLGLVGAVGSGLAVRRRRRRVRPA